ncbi:MAG: 5,10-methylenetetrahydrofolate reductase [Firmicutes bacterium ADurb.Bin300]|nr:MAG: 5,10-methylenetetrahydrofolate reductase [Firmicutes bacterium ADurb.Bin300]
MKTIELFKKKTVLSFEIFPPKRTNPVDTVYDTVERLKDLKPDFISVTYGAGGSESNADTLKIASAVKNDYGTESVAHLPCVNLTKNDVLEMLGKLKRAGIENILALRGDVNPDFAPKNDFKYASDLISFIRENGDFNIIGACYPEGHFEASSLIEDIRNLKKKTDAGASHLITQLFFDNGYFYSFRERAVIAGIDVPIQAGIMPVVNKKQIERMVSLCKVDLPKKFLSMMTKYENNPSAMRDAGIAYAVDQIVDLLAQGVDGIHLYTMNNPYIARRIYEAVSSLID